MIYNFNTKNPPTKTVNYDEYGNPIEMVNNTDMVQYDELGNPIFPISLSNKSSLPNGNLPSSNIPTGNLAVDAVSTVNQLNAFDSKIRSDAQSLLNKSSSVELPSANLKGAGEVISENNKVVEQAQKEDSEKATNYWMNALSGVGNTYSLESALFGLGNSLAKPDYTGMDDTAKKRLNRSRLMMGIGSAGKLLVGGARSLLGGHAYGVRESHVVNDYITRARQNIVNNGVNNVSAYANATNNNYQGVNFYGADGGYVEGNDDGYDDAESLSVAFNRAKSSLKAGDSFTYDGITYVIPGAPQQPVATLMDERYSKPFVNGDKSNHSQIPLKYIKSLNLKTFEDSGRFKGEQVWQTYERVTGKKWKTAMEEGLTDGSLKRNLELQRKLLQSETLDVGNASPVKKKPVVEVGYPTSEFIDDKGEVLRWYMTEHKPDGSTVRVPNPNFKSIEPLLLKPTAPTVIQPVQQTIPNFDFKQTPVVVVNTPRTNNDGGWLNNMVSTVSDGFDKGVSTIKDYATMANNYVTRHYLDEEVESKGIVKTSNTPKKNVVEQEYLPENRNDTYLHGERLFVQGVFDLDKMKFDSRNRGDMRPVKGGDVALITTFKPFTETPSGGENFVYLDKQGKVDVISRDIASGKKGLFSPVVELPLNRMSFSKDGSKVKLVSSPDMNNKVIDLGDVNDSRYNSGIGVGKDFGEWADIKDLNKFSFLNGAKVLFKVNNKKYVVSGSGMDIINAYKELSKKGDVKSYKLDNGSFNLPMRAKNQGVFDAEDLRAHQLRNSGGGHSLISIK